MVGIILPAVPAAQPPHEAHPPPEPALALSLSDALTLALARNRTLSEARIDSAIAAEMRKAAATRRWPQLDFEAGATRRSDVPTVPLGEILPQFPGLPDFSAAEIRMGDKETYDAQLIVTEAIFAGGRISNAIAAREALSERATWQLEAAATDLIGQVVSAYFGLLKAQQAVEISGAAVEQARARESDAANLLSEGLATRDELLALEAHVGRSRIALLESQHRASLAGLDLLRLLALPLDRPVHLTSPPDELSRRIGPAGLARRETAPPRTRAETQAMSAARESARRKVALERAARVPLLTGMASAAYGRPGLDPFADEWAFYWTAGLALRWTVWDWGLRTARIEAAQLELRRLAQSSAALEDHLILEAEATRLALREAHERVALADQLLAAARERLRIVGDRFAQGLATANDLIVAQQEDTQARLAQAAAMADLQIAITARDRALGWIDPRAGQAVGGMP